MFTRLPIQYRTLPDHIAKNHPNGLQPNALGLNGKIVTARPNVFMSLRGDQERIQTPILLRETQTLNHLPDGQNKTSGAKPPHLSNEYALLRDFRKG